MLGFLKVLTHKSFFSEYIFRPLKDLQNMSKKKIFQKKTLKNDFENRSEVLTIVRRDKRWKVRTFGGRVGKSADKARPSIFRRVMTLGKLSGPRNDFQSHFSRSFFGKKIFLDIFWRSFRGLKTYSEKKRFVGQDF